MAPARFTVSPVFERFSERARQVVVLAQEEARLLRHNYIGTEHILLGLLREEEGIAARALESLEISVEEVRAQVARIVGEGDEVTVGQIPFTPRAKKVLEVALREALSLGHDYLGTEHILLGLVRVNEGVAPRILLELGVDAEKVENEVLGMLSPEGPRPGLLSGRGPGRASRRGRRPVQWEYRVVEAQGDEPITERELNALGAEGWELAGVVDGVRLIFKRPRRS